MGHKFLGLVAFFIVLVVLFNEMKNISYFIYKYLYIKDLSNIEKQKCDDLYTEAETARFQMAKNLFDLLLPNDIYNSKTYIVFITIFSILFYIYVCYKYIHYLNEEAYQLSSIISAIIILHALIYIILNIVFRFVPYDEAGYMGYFLGKDGIADSKMFNKMMLPTIFTCMFIFLIYNLITDTDNFDFHRVWVYALYYFYYVFALFFMFNMINIVETFKSNKTSYDIEPIMKNLTADISYENENGFYNKYFDLRDIPKGFFINPSIFFLREDNYSYGIHRMYAGKMEQIALMLFIFIMIFIIFVIIWKFTKIDIDNKKMQNTIYMVLPLLYLFLLLTIIINYMKFNTMFNKDVLYAINSVYKHDLNDLNNVVTPYISLYNNYTSLQKQRNYIYNYVVFNVLMSYLEGHINIFTNASNVDKKIELGSKYYTYEQLIKKGIKFKYIDINDINNDGKFKEYYNQRFHNVFSEEFWKNMTRNTFMTKENWYDHLFKGITYTEYFDTKLDGKNNEKYNLKSEKKNVIKNNIKKNIYKMLSVCDMDSFNNSLKKYNFDDDSEDMTKHSKPDIFDNGKVYIYVSNNDASKYSCYIYKFLIKYPLDVPNYEELRTKYERLYQQENNSCSSSIMNFDTKLNDLIENFLVHIESLYMDYDSYTAEDQRFKNKLNKNTYKALSANDKIVEQKKSEDFLDKIFNSSMMVFNIMKDNIYKDKYDEKSHNFESDCYKGKSLYYLYTNILDNVNVYLESNNNYLKNVIENIYFKENDTQSRVVLYDFDNTFYKDNDTIKTQIEMVENIEPNNMVDNLNALNVYKKELNEDILHRDSKIMYVNPIANQLINNSDILDKANAVITQEFFSIYIINMFLISIIFLLIIYT